MDNTTILSWNVRGLNARARQDNVRTLVNDVRPSIVCLQETKLDVIPQSLVWSMLGIEFSDFAYLPATHTRGGISGDWAQMHLTIAHCCFRRTWAKWRRLGFKFDDFEQVINQAWRRPAHAADPFTCLDIMLWAL